MYSISLLNQPPPPPPFHSILYSFETSVENVQGMQRRKYWPFACHFEVFTQFHTISSGFKVQCFSHEHTYF